MVTLMLAFSVASRGLLAQGITSAALEGRVVQNDGQPIDVAVIMVTAAASGVSWQVRTDGRGRFFLENVQVGGPYVIEARALGFRPARISDVVLTLGQRYRADFVLERKITELGAVTVRADVDPMLNSGRTGPAHILSETDIAELPNTARDISAAAALGPLSVLRPLGGISVGGQNQGYNNLQVDGGINADVYLGRTPGGASPSGALPEVQPHAISLETVREFQVLAAPFDVRLGNFAGGLLNAVTKSGTNVFRGSVFGFLQHGSLTARSSYGERSDFTTSQFGLNLSGPIVRDRVHFFLNADVQRRVVPDPGPLVTDPGRTGVRDTSLLRFQQILETRYGLDAGAHSSTGRLPAEDLFGKITLQLGAFGHLELSQRYAHADRGGFIDVGRSFDSTALASVSGRSRSIALTSRMIWNVLVAGRAQSELILSYARLRDSCRPAASFPLIQVRADSGVLIAGPNSVCPTTDVTQGALEVTENVTIGVGDHLVTLGAHTELLQFRDPLVQVSAGRWDFLNLANLDAGIASHYDRGIPPADRPPGAYFRAVGVGLYAQDRWMPTGRVTLTAGVRLDVPFLPDALPTNQDLARVYGVDTGRLPRGNEVWSPRLGLNYDVNGDGSTFLRGGVGLFSGPPPYRWLGNAYRESGDESVVLCARPFAVPPFTPNDQPLACDATGRGRSPRISYFAPGFRHPQNLKLALGVDRRLPWNVTAVFDFLYTRAVHQIYVDQVNLQPPQTRATGEGGRVMYGMIGPGGHASPAWYDTSFGQKEVYRVSNRAGDYGLSLSTQLRKRYGEALALHASYGWSRVRDRMSLVNFPARANFSNTPVDGTLSDRALRPSFFETPHKVSLAATLGLPWETSLALVYFGASQPPYTFVINGDANADGIGAAGSLKNDIVYVPADAGDISLDSAADVPRLESYIERHKCLREQRGRIMQRGSCRNPWLGQLNARLTKVIPLAGRHRFDLSADIVNVPNLISSRWGRQENITTNPSVTLLTLTGWDAANERGRYRLAPKLPAIGIADEMQSRWRIQIGARYHF